MYFKAKLQYLCLMLFVYFESGRTYSNKVTNILELNHDSDSRTKDEEAFAKKTYTVKNIYNSNYFNLSEIDFANVISQLSEKITKDVDCSKVTTKNVEAGNNDNITSINNQIQQLKNDIKLLQTDNKKLMDLNSQIPSTENALNSLQDIVNNHFTTFTKQSKDFTREVDSLKQENVKLKAALDRQKTLMDDLKIRNSKQLDHIPQPSPKPSLPPGKVVYAINCAGPAHVGAHGIHYQRDPLLGNAAVTNWLENEAIGRASPQDYQVYRSVRWSCNPSMNYNFPLPEDGDYVLVLKFIEAFVRNVNERVFDVLLNDQFVLVSRLDVLSRVSFGVAYDRSFEFSINGRYLHYENQRMLHDGHVISVNFIKRIQCPDIAALYVISGKAADVPK